MNPLKTVDADYVYYISLEATSYQDKRFYTRPVILKASYNDSQYLPKAFLREDIEGPFSSLKNLVTKSTLYLRLKAEKSHWVNKIVHGANIKNVRTISFLSSYDSSFKEKIWKILQHTVSGELCNGDVMGIHYYDGKIKTVRIHEEKRIDKNGVWEASVEYRHVSSTEWKLKSNLSTFFPKSWDLETLIIECEFAFRKMARKGDATNIYRGISKSGVPIIFVIDIYGSLKSVYPEFTPF